MTKTQLAKLRSEPIPPSGNRVALAFDIDGRPQAECARITGFTPQYINDVKAGRKAGPNSTIEVENAHKLAAFFGCLIEDLFPSREAAA